MHKATMSVKYQCQPHIMHLNRSAACNCHYAARVADCALRVKLHSVELIVSSVWPRNEMQHTAPWLCVSLKCPPALHILQRPTSPVLAHWKTSTKYSLPVTCSYAMPTFWHMPLS